MARNPRDRWLTGRVDTELGDYADKYVDLKNMTISELVVAALKEFRFAHPLPAEPKENTDAQ